jgi:hypothetical protein
MEGGRGRARRRVRQYPIPRGNYPALRNHSVNYHPFIKSQLPHVLNFRTLRGANLVTYPADIRGNRTREVHRQEGRPERRPFLFRKDYAGHLTYPQTLPYAYA